MEKKVFCSPLSSQERDWKKEYRAWIHKKRKLLLPPFYLSLKSLFLFPGNWLHTLRHPQHRSKKPFFFLFLIFLLKPAQKTQNPHPFFFWVVVCCWVGFLLGRSVVVDPGRITLPEWLRHTARNKNTNPIMYTTKSKPHPPNNQKIGHRERNPWNTHQGHEHTRHTHTHTQQAQHGIMLMNKFQPDEKKIKIKQKKK